MKCIWFILYDIILIHIRIWNKNNLLVGLKMCWLYPLWKGKTLLRKRCTKYDKTSDGEVSVLKIWSIASLPLLPGPLWPRVVVPLRIPSMSQIDQFKDYLYSKGLCARKNSLKKYIHKKCRYECMINIIP